MAAACAITGRQARALRDLAGVGKVPGAGKIGARWTFDVAKLRAWINAAEAVPCQNAQKPRHTATGGRTARTSGAGNRSTSANIDGAYTRTIQRLLGNESKRTADASSRPRGTGRAGSHGRNA